MSDPDNMPDPIDAAYREAEAMLRDDAERAARRARVLAAVAQAVQTETMAPPPPPPRKQASLPPPWLIAASAAGVAALVALEVAAPWKIQKPTPPEPAPSPSPPPPPPPPAVAERGPGGQAETSPSPTVTQPPATAPRQSAEPVYEDLPAPPPLPIPPVERRVQQPAPPVVFAPPPLPIPPVERRVEQAAPPVITASPPAPAPPILMAPPAPAPPRPRAMGANVESAAPGEPARLRAAATAGRVEELESLLNRGAFVDAVDDEGETALMRAVRSRQFDAAALLRRYGASLDLPNRAGVTVRRMARDIADARLNTALGLPPP